MNIETPISFKKEITSLNYKKGEREKFTSPSFSKNH